MERERGPSDRQIALYVSFGVGATIAVITIGTFWWIFSLVLLPDLQAAAEAAAKPYSPSEGILNITLAEANVPEEGDSRSPWLGLDAWITGVQAGQTYADQFPETQPTVRILTELNTSQIWQYMIQISAGLGVSCQYCHDINNFPAYTYPQKASALSMLIMMGSLNGQFVNDTNLPNWQGNYVRCDTCHNGLPKGMPTVSEQFEQSTPPIEVVLEPLDENGEPVREPEIRVSLQEATIYYLYNYLIWLPFDPVDPMSGRGSLSMTHENGRTQEQVTISQNTMNLMSWSLGQGCNFCHNSRNFYAYEDHRSVEEGFGSNNPGSQLVQLNGYNRLKAQRMLLMTTWFGETWNTSGALPLAEAPEEPFVNRQYIQEISGSHYALPGCYTCHQGANIPRTAVNQADLVDETILGTRVSPLGDVEVSGPILPAVLRGEQ
ncbi:MAG: photosynthetic reaction center cytochrome c subunit [Chloroflexaceae bacterium]|nr:photosynthetic reaction center cytochrome c subunit [Chloroflexaceae bacterium]